MGKATEVAGKRDVEAPPGWVTGDKVEAVETTESEEEVEPAPSESGEASVEVIAEDGIVEEASPDEVTEIAGDVETVEASLSAPLDVEEEEIVEVPPFDPPYVEDPVEVDTSTDEEVTIEAQAAIDLEVLKVVGAQPASEVPKPLQPYDSNSILQIGRLVDKSFTNANRRNLLKMISR